MRSIVLTASVYTALAAAALHAQGFPGNLPDLNRRGDSVARLELWVNTVHTDAATLPDEAIRQIAGWTLADLDDLAIELQSMLTLMGDPQGDSFSLWVDSGRTPGPRRVLYSRSELDRLRRLARSSGGRTLQERPAPDDEARITAAQNRLMKRGTAMHTTVALSRPDDTDTPPVNFFAPRWDGLIQFNDGRQVRLDGRSNHWKFARRLLDRMTAEASRDGAVRAWYHASCAALLGMFRLHPDHFDDALRLFPDDPFLLMLEGSLHEAFASARVQPFVKSAVLPRGVVLRVGSPRAELGRAESALQRAVKIDPRAIETRVRLGRVLSLQGRHADALTEFGRIDARAETVLQYYAALFTGDAAEALGRAADARAAYERAATLYPEAQAPRLGLSHLAMITGDRTRATTLASVTDDRERADDPFWTYYTSSGRNAAALLATAYDKLLAETVP